MRRIVLGFSVAIPFLLLVTIVPHLIETPAEIPDAATSRKGREDQGLARLLGAGRDVETLRNLHDEFLAQGEADWAGLCVSRILDIRPQDDWASRRAGRADLREIYARIPVTADLELYPDRAAELLFAWREAGIRWGTDGDREKGEELLEAATRHAVRLRGDPVYRDEWLWRTWMRHHPIFKDLPTVTEHRPPYLVFTDEVEDGGAHRTLDRTAGLLSRLYEEFRRHFAAPFDLPDLTVEARGALRVAKVFVFSNERFYRGYQNLIRDPVGAQVEAHYRLDDQWIVLYEDDRMADKLLFTGVQQLLHFYRKVLVERDIGVEIPWTDERLRSGLGWFETGFARFLGSARRDDAGEWELMVPNRELLDVWQELPQRAAGTLALETMLADEWPDDVEPEDVYGRAVMAWSFCHFLWHHDDGQYRDRLVAYLGEELHGRSGPEVFAQTFWDDASPDWPGIEAEWRRYVDTLAEE